MVKMVADILSSLTFPNVIRYRDGTAIDCLKAEKRTTHNLGAET